MSVTSPHGLGRLGWKSGCIHTFLPHDSQRLSESELSLCTVAARRFESIAIVILRECYPRILPPNRKCSTRQSHCGMVSIGCQEYADRRWRCWVVLDCQQLWLRRNEVLGLFKSHQVIPLQQLVILLGFGGTVGWGCQTAPCFFGGFVLLSSCRQCSQDMLQQWGVM